MISVLFQCHARPELTQLCLERSLDILSKYDYELIVLYDSNDPEYFKLIKEFSPDWMIIGGGGRGNILNRAYEIARGEYFLFLENDWYWVDDCIELAKSALKEIDFIRLLKTPLNPKGVNNGVYTIHPDKKSFRWNFNPHMTKEKFLAGRFPEDRWSIEGIYCERFNETNKISALMNKDYFVHLGVISSRLKYRLQHLMRMNYKDPIEFFNQFNPSSKHMELYKEYLLTDKGYE